jgi:hypothetical protein
MLPLARHFAWSCAAACFFAACCVGPAARAATPEQVAKLITDLGSEEFTAREAASEELTRLGLAAFSALEAAATHPDREVRYRSQRILGLIREHDLKRRLEAFLSGKEATGDYPLPGWTRFKKTYGDEAQTRAIFVDMQRGDPELLRAVEEGPRPAADLLSQRVNQFQESLRIGVQPQFSAGQVAAELFVAAEEDVTLPATSTMLLLNQCYQQTFRDVISGGKSELPRKMLGAIIRRSDDSAAFQAMQVAKQLNLPDGIVPALRILNNKTAVRSPHMTVYALITVTATGDKEHLPLVEKLLSDNAQISRMQQNQVQLDLQVRDAALAAAVLLSKQELKDFFDLKGKPQVTDPQSIMLNPSLIGFANETDRAAVFKKWEVYKAKQPAEAKPAEAKPAP